jgi:pimeloyl-ACP methyl ester carboxylesterase
MSINVLRLTTAPLTEATSVAFTQAIQFQKISTPLSELDLETSFVCQGTQGKTPILLLHGFDSSVLEFRRLLPLLAIQNESWAVDLFGFGFTERPERQLYSPDTIKTHLYYFWKTLIQRPVVLVGASMGGAAALDFTLTYPQAVQKLILLDSAGFSGGPAMGKFLFPPLGYLATEFLRNPKVRQRISENAYSDQSFASLDALRCAALHLEQPGWSRALIGFTKSGGYPSLQARLGQLQLPTLILWGQFDRILGTRDANRLQGAIAGSQLIWIPNCGHVPHLEQPQITAQHILQFIAPAPELGKD